MILIGTLVGFWWLDIGCTDNSDALYLVQVALINNLVPSCHILFQNLFHGIEKSNIVGIQDDHCYILWKWITWINKGCLFAIRKQNIETFLSAHTLTIDRFNSFVTNMVLTPPNSFLKQHILNNTSVVLIRVIISLSDFSCPDTSWEMRCQPYYWGRFTNTQYCTLSNYSSCHDVVIKMI